MQITKIEAGEYKVEKDNIEYLISKDSYTGDWNIYSNKKYLMSKDTKKECLDFIELGHSVKILDSISVIPNIDLDSHFVRKCDKNTIWTVRDLTYSIAKGKWSIEGSYYKNPIDSGYRAWDEDNFRKECDIISDGCGRKYKK